MDKQTTNMHEVSVIIGIVILVLITFPYIIGELENEIYKETGDTQYTYDVMSVTTTHASFWNEKYVVITYLKNGLLTNERFDNSDSLYVVISNESKIVFENPELIGRPVKITLHWNFNNT